MSIINNQLPHKRAMQAGQSLSSWQIWCLPASPQRDTDYFVPAQNVRQKRKKIKDYADFADGEEKSA